MSLARKLLSCVHTHTHAHTHTHTHITPVYTQQTRNHVRGIKCVCLYLHLPARSVVSVSCVCVALCVYVRVHECVYVCACRSVFFPPAHALILSIS